MHNHSPLVGVLGAGQLGRMLALAGYPLGMRFRFADESASTTAAQLAEFVECTFGNVATLAGFGEGLDVLTYEFENVPVSVARSLEHTVSVFPPPQALEVSQDRLTEKNFLNQVDIPTPGFLAVSSRDELDAGLVKLGMPAILKTRRMGYDGKGQYRINTVADIDAAWESFGGVPLILEQWVDFEYEVSQLSVRSCTGEIVHYPLVHNTHRDGILRVSTPITKSEHSYRAGDLPRLAQQYAYRLLGSIQYVGVLAVEFFVTANALLANEMAPRVHNSGHWTIEGAETSQFENHLRAITGLPLGSTALNGYSSMVNIIGQLPDRKKVLALPGAHLHLYGKEPRPGRKLGHVTIRATTAESRDEITKRVSELVAN